MKLCRTYVEKPWGTTQLPSIFDAPEGRRIGEVHFTNGADLPLLAKYIFTCERLSIQVHPDDEQAKARGLPKGKSECWYIVDAEPNSTIALGLKHGLSPEELRAAALDGSIEGLVDWRHVRAGDFYFVPAGTIHAIGGGLSLIEFQQNSDVTYRLYDYGRPRELHIDAAVSVANLTPRPEGLALRLAPDEQRTLVDGPPFTVVLSDRDSLQDRQRWVIPLEGKVKSASDVAIPGEVLVLAAGERLDCDGTRLLIGAVS